MATIPRFSYICFCLGSIATIAQCAAIGVKATWQENAAQNLVDIIGGFEGVTVLPLGASITWGTQSSTGNGFRASLVEDLNTVLTPKVFSCVGNTQSGNSRNSAYSSSVSSPGRTIIQVRQNVTGWLESGATCPDITVLHAGTNDVKGSASARSDAPQQLGDLIDALYGYCSDMSLFVAQLIMNTDPNVEKAVQQFNADILPIIQTRTQQGKKIVVVDMHSVVAQNEMKDGTHPNDAGYVKMAKKWEEAIVAASAKEWF